MTQVFFTSKGERIESDLEDYECTQILNDAAKDRTPSDFAMSLMQAEIDDRLTDRQRPWLHKLALEARDGGSNKPESRTVDGMRPIYDLMHTAKQSLKYPKVRVLGVQLSVAGDRARIPGSINVTSIGSYHETDWYGRITDDGAFNPARGCPDWVAESLKQIANDPSGVAASEGRVTGSCCFCCQELSTKESLYAGYGPVCADNYGLPWGETGEDAA